MRVRYVALALVLTLAPSSVLSGQAFNLRDLLVNFVENGITLDPALVGGVNHARDFTGFQSVEGQALFLAVRTLNEQIANQLSSSPLPSPGGGFTYRFEPGVGFTRAADSFGPIYADRSDTVGKGKLNLGVNYSHFSFERIDGLRLRDGDVKLVFTNRDVNQDGELFHPYYEGDLIAAQLLLKVDTDVTTFAFTYGLTDRLDVSALIPVARVSIKAQLGATMARLATGKTDPTIHRFANGGDSDSFQSSGSASGLSDIAVRAKLQALRGDAGGLAVAADIRFPSGNERDLLGTGAVRIKGSLIGSLHLGSFSPHLNAGYTWSSTPPDDRSSVRDQAAPRAQIPDEISYAGGFDVAMGPRVTFAADVLGGILRKAQTLSVVDHTFQANTNPNDNEPPTIVQTTLPRLTAQEGDVHTLLGAAGVKINPFANLLVTVNALFALDRRHGLQPSTAPFVGIDYSF